MDISMNSETERQLMPSTSSTRFRRSDSTFSQTSSESSPSPGPNTHFLSIPATFTNASPLSLESSVEPSSIGAMIEKYSGLLSIFAFERAHEFSEKQYCQKGGDPTWTSLANVMMQLANFERLYMNLAFLAPKGFLRKDSNLKGMGDHIRVELKKFTESSHAKLASEFLVFVTLRLDLIEFYEKLCLLGTAKNVEISDLISDLEVLSEKRNDEIKSLGENLSAAIIFKSLEWEVEMIYNLLKSHASTTLWDFFNAMIAIQEAQKMILEWGEHLQQNQLTKKSSFLKSNSTNPCLYVWLLKFKGTLLSKISLYFYEILSRNSNAAFDIRVISAKLQTDYFTRISTFQKKSDALAMCLVFDTRGVDFFPNGYQHPIRPIEVPKGLDTFPAILAIPQKPLTHWPNVVMLMTGRMTELSADKLIGFFDTQVQSTYFIVRIEPRMFFVAVYESKKSEKDSYTVKFMNEIATELRCGKIFSSIKLNLK